MTTKEFVKKFVAKQERLAAEEVLDSMLGDSESYGFLEAVKEVKWHLRGVANEIGSW